MVVCQEEEKEEEEGVGEEDEEEAENAAEVSHQVKFVDVCCLLMCVKPPDVPARTLSSGKVPV